MSLRRRVRNFTGGPGWRSCGDCDLCCTVLPVWQLDLAAGEPCPHLRESGGCGIYGGRPEVCRTYACLWLWGEGDLQQRPDRMRAVPTMSDNGRYLVFYLSPGLTPETMSRDTARWLRNWQRKAKRPVLVLSGDGYDTTTVFPVDGEPHERKTKWVGNLPTSMQPAGETER